MPLLAAPGPRPDLTYAPLGGSRPPLAARETPPAPGRPRFLDTVRAALRTRHYSRRTEEAYVAWIRRYIVFHGKRHPRDLGPAEVSRFLTWLAVDRRVAASTQNQALGSGPGARVAHTPAADCRRYTASAVTRDELEGSAS